MFIFIITAEQGVYLVKTSLNHLNNFTNLGLDTGGWEERDHYYKVKSREVPGRLFGILVSLAQPPLSALRAWNRLIMIWFMLYGILDDKNLWCTQPIVSILPCVCSIQDHKRCQNVQCRSKNKKAPHTASVPLVFLSHFVVFCDPILKRPMAKWNFLVL